MTLLSHETLIGFLDLIAEEGATVAEASAAIGASEKSKIVYKWIADSEAAGEFGARPDPNSPYCVEWNGRPLEWLHVLFAEAVAAGKIARKDHRSALRADLESKLSARRKVTATVDKIAPPRIEIFRPDAPSNSIRETTPDDPAQHEPRVTVDVARRECIPVATPASDRPSYAYRAKPLDASNGGEPPAEGRFSVARHVVSQAERRAGTVSFDDTGIKHW
jgi:hypothetical protein